MEERLAKRRRIVELRNLQQQKQEEEIGVHCDGFQIPTNRLIESGHYSEKQKKELLGTYESDLQKIHHQHQKGLLFLLILPKVYLLLALK